MNPEITKIIEQYLAGELSPTDQQAFEDRLASNKELREEVEFQRTIHEAAKRSAVRAQVTDVAKNFHFMKKLKWGGFGAGALIIAAVSTMYVMKYNSSGNLESAENDPQFSKITETLKDDAPIDNLASEFFAWNANDTAFLSKEGVLISVPDNALLLNGQPYNDPAVIQWQEALDGASIIKSGLSTVSNGELLETQGMFSFSAKTKDEQELTIDPKIGIYVQVPVDEYKEGMQLFDGQKDSTGMINWVSPRALEKIPVPVPMSQLDFYPPEYEAKLNELKARKTKKYRDSLYLSFEYDYATAEEEVRSVNVKSVLVPNISLALPARPIDPEEMYLIYGETRPINNNISFYEAFVIVNENKFIPGDLVTFPLSYFINDTYGRMELFSKAENDPELKAYLIKKGIIRVPPPSGPNLISEAVSSGTATSDSTEEGNYIHPSSVLAFWQKKFDNTILATREFESRMTEIHRTCDKTVLDLYVRNLSKPMHELDALAAAKGYPQFKTFAEQFVGALNPNDPHLKTLNAFYKEAIKQLKTEEASNRNAETARQKQWDQQVQDERNKENIRTAVRDQQAFNEEYVLNHKNVRKQLGRVLGARIYGNSPICNIDRFVRETTLARKTGSFYDQQTGKTATIKYNPFTFKIKDAEKYEKIFAYMLPDKLNSYHRLNGKNGEFSFPLNDEITYDLAIVGVSIDGFSFVERRKVKGGDLGIITLHPTEEVKLNNAIYAMNKKRGINAFDVTQEFKWLQKEQRNYVEQKRRADDLKFRNQVRPSVYPCLVHGNVGSNVDKVITLPQ